MQGRAWAIWVGSHLAWSANNSKAGMHLPAYAYNLHAFLPAEAIDLAFVDRADIKAYIGPPTLQARYLLKQSHLKDHVRSAVLQNIEQQRCCICP